MFPPRGLAPLLARRRRPSSPSVAVCVALIGCLDPIDEVAVQFNRFSSAEVPFLEAVDREAAKRWLHRPSLGALANAWLHRWEQHNFAAMEQFTAGRDLVSALSHLATLASLTLRNFAWEAVASAIAIWRYRDLARLGREVTPELLMVLVDHLDTDIGDPAASMLACIAESRVRPELVASVRPQILAKLADTAETVRERLRPIIESSGLMSARLEPPLSRDTPMDVVDEIHRATDLGALEAFCRASNVRVVQEAALRLIELGEVGRERLMEILAGVPPPGVRYIIESIPLWPEGEALQNARALAATDASPEVRFRISVAFLERGDRAMASGALAAVCAESSDPWFRAEDWERLISLGFTASTTSPSPSRRHLSRTRIAAPCTSCSRWPSSMNQSSTR